MQATGCLTYIRDRLPIGDSGRVQSVRRHGCHQQPEQKDSESLPQTLALMIKRMQSYIESLTIQILLCSNIDDLATVAYLWTHVRVEVILCVYQ
jgi:hypothetical protein